MAENSTIHRKLDVVRSAWVCFGDGVFLCFLSTGIVVVIT